MNQARPDPLHLTSLRLALRTLTILVLVAIGSITVARAFCGDEVVEAPDEQCDGPNLVGFTCTDLGYSGGTLACSSSCFFDTSGCTTTCGNDVAEPTEECDGADLNGMSCVNLGYAGGILNCDPICFFDTSECQLEQQVCGNGIQEDPEQCDDGNTTSGDGCNEFCQIEECQSDGDCDNGFICDGVEFCDPMFFICLSGGPVNCSDGDPCTFDSCNPEDGQCLHVPSGDGETALGADALCDTVDDNLALFGPDAMCGTGDEGTGDGVCSALDNCPQAWNPAQVDSDIDRAGDACDASACPSLTAYVTDFDRLVRVEVATGAQEMVSQPGPELADVEIWDTEQQSLAFVAAGFGQVMAVDLLSPGLMFDLGPGFLQPWGLALHPSGSPLLVTDSESGEVVQLDDPLQGGPNAFSVATELSQPRGIALDADDNVAYVAEYGSGELSRIDFVDPTPSTVATGLSGPTGVALSEDGSTAYVTEADSGELSRVDLQSGTVTLVTDALSSPQDLVLDESGTIAYVVQSFGPLLAVELATGNQTPIAQLEQPVGIALRNPGGIQLALPEAATGAPGMSLAVPVSVPDVTGQGVLSADFTVEFNPAVLSITDVGPGSLTGGCTLTSNLGVPGRVVVSIFCTSELSGEGSLANLVFDVVGEEGDSTPLQFVQGLLNEGDPSVCLEGGAFLIPVQIAGRISYYRDHATASEPSTKRVAGVNLNLTDPSVQPPVVTQEVSGCGGDYLFPAVLPGRNYSLTTRKANDFGAAIDPFDASLNAQHVVGLISLTPYQRLAADVTGNGTLSSLDSARIAQFSVGLIPEFPVAVTNGDWTFVPVAQPEPNAFPQNPFPPGGTPGGILYSPIVESAENQDFLGVLFGDISGNWQPPTCSLTDGPTLQSGLVTEASPSVSAGGGMLSLPTLTARPGDIIQVPVTGTGVAQAVSFYLDLRYNANVLRLVQAQAGAATSGFSVTTNLQEPGRARLALFRATPAGADGVVSVLTFEVIGKPGSRSWVRVPTYTVNEGRIAVSVDDGQVQVERRLKGRQSPRETPQAAPSGPSRRVP